MLGQGRAVEGGLNQRADDSAPLGCIARAQQVVEWLVWALVASRKPRADRKSPSYLPLFSTDLNCLDGSRCRTGGDLALPAARLGGGGAGGKEGALRRQDF